MNNADNSSVADKVDRSLQLIAFVMFAVSLMFALSVVEFFAGETMAVFLDIATKILAISVVLLMAALFIWKFRGTSRTERREYLSEDGFLQVSFQRAMARSWMISFLILAILQVLDESLLARLPTMPLEVVIQCVLAIMLAFFSIAFFLFTRTIAGEDSIGEFE